MLKAAERDVLLIRMDERLKLLKDGDEGAVPEILNRLKDLNGSVGKNTAFRRIVTYSGIPLFLGLLGLGLKIMGIY